MDRHFLEFWGNFFIHAAKGHKQMEELTQWIHQGMKGFEDLAAMFRKFYGLEGMPEDSPDYLKAWRKASENIRKSFDEYLGLMGAVPRNEHLTLVKKYEDLKEKVAEQGETIKHLQMLLDAKGMDQGETVKGFQDLLKKQTEDFHALMEGFGQILGKDSSAD
jgi:hypothetical protein